MTETGPGNSLLLHRKRALRASLAVGLAFFCFIVLVLRQNAGPVTAEAFTPARLKMTEEIAAMGVHQPEVLDAMRTVPRHEFVPAAQKPFAYENRPLPIGHGQTISQPYIVGLMTELARVDKNSVVFEVGTGSGYQAAILSALVKKVYTVEYLEPLGLEAKKRLRDLGYANVEVRIGDGYRGWPERQPFDAILVTAGIDHVPPPLIEQLKPGGRMVIPIDDPQNRAQDLLLIEKDLEGNTWKSQTIPVKFVPFLGPRQ